MHPPSRAGEVIPTNPTIHGTLINAMEALNHADCDVREVRAVLFGPSPESTPSTAVPMSPLEDRPVEVLARNLSAKAQELLEQLSQIKVRI